MRIGALIPDIKHKRNKRPKFVGRSMNYFGLQMVMNEIEKKFNLKVEFTTADDHNTFDIILVSLHSIEDVYNLIWTIDKHKCETRTNIWIAGGAAVCNIKPIASLFNFIAIGRGEKTILEIMDAVLTGRPPSNNHWFSHKFHLPHDAFSIRYADQLYPDRVGDRKETMYGCKYNCFYCRYRYSSLPPNKRPHDRETTMPGNEETFWELKVEAGKFQTTSLDGFTEYERYAVNKKISNSAIIAKFSSIPPQSKPISLKVYMIVGYPGTKAPLLDEWMALMAKLNESVQLNRIILKIYVTPFSAEPQTPMQWCPIQIKFDYNKFFRDLTHGKSLIYKGDRVECYIRPGINSPYTLLKRAIFNRGNTDSLELMRHLIHTPFHNSHNNTHALKLERLIQDYDISHYYRQYRIGDALPSSNISSWSDDSLIESQAARVHGSFGIGNSHATWF